MSKIAAVGRDHPPPAGSYCFGVLIEMHSANYSSLAGYGPGLPEEILLEIVTYLSKTDVTKVVRVSMTFWRIAIPFVWDCLEKLEGNGHLCHLLQITEDGPSDNQVAGTTSYHFMSLTDVLWC